MVSRQGVRTPIFITVQHPCQIDDDVREARAFVGVSVWFQSFYQTTTSPTFSRCRTDDGDRSKIQAPATLHLGSSHGSRYRDNFPRYATSPTPEKTERREWVRKLTVQEITRLQHSLDHLKSTQDQLQYLIDTTSESTPDPDFIGAIQENIDVMYEAISFILKVVGCSPRSLMNRSSNSQEERISILKHALVQKGVVSPSHYDLEPSRSTQSATVNPEQNPPSTTAANGDDGLYI